MTTNNSSQTPTTPQPGTAEYDAAMAAKFDTAQANATAAAVTNTETPARPEWLPEKFTDGEALAKAYKELEKKLGQGGQQPAATATATQAAATETPANPDPAITAATRDNNDTVEQVVTEAGLDFDALSAKVAQTGKLEDADYSALEGKGIPRAMVDAYVAGQQALAAQRATEVYSTVGGQDAYGQLIQWAGSNMTQAEIDAFNSVVDRGDLNATKLAVAGLQAKYAAAGDGPSPTLVQGDNGAATADVFESTAQLTAAMRDPRYKTDAAYRNAVTAKLGRSKIL